MEECKRLRLEHKYTNRKPGRLIGCGKKLKIMRTFLAILGTVHYLSEGGGVKFWPLKKGGPGVIESVVNITIQLEDILTFAQTKD